MALELVGVEAGQGDPVEAGDDGVINLVVRDEVERVGVAAVEEEEGVEALIQGVVVEELFFEAQVLSGGYLQAGFFFDLAAESGFERFAQLYSAAGEAIFAGGRDVAQQQAAVLKDQAVDGGAENQLFGGQRLDTAQEGVAVDHDHCSIEVARSCSICQSGQAPLDMSMQREQA